MTAYIIYRGESPGGVTYLTELNGTNYDDGSVAAGTMYYYQVSARNMAGEGPKSSVVSASINAGTWTLSGRVSGSESGDGIADARLFFERQGPSQGSKETRTDGSGNYNIALEGGNYRVVIEADDHESREEHITLNGDQVMDFRLDEKNGGKEDFNLSKILGIDEEKVEKVARTAGVIAGIYLCSIPLMLFIVVVLLFLTFLRLGKIKKELRAKNEMEGIFISKRRQKKLEKEKKKEEEKVVEDKKGKKKGK